MTTIEPADPLFRTRTCTAPELYLCSIRTGAGALCPHPIWSEISSPRASDRPTCFHIFGMRVTLASVGKGVLEKHLARKVIVERQLSPRTVIGCACAPNKGRVRPNTAVRALTRQRPPPSQPTIDKFERRSLTLNLQTRTHLEELIRSYGLVPCSRAESTPVFQGTAPLPLKRDVHSAE